MTGKRNPASKTLNISGLLWQDVHVFDDHYLKSASALIAIQQVLERKPLLGAHQREFLNIYSSIVSSDPQVFAKIWLDPSAHLWTRITFQLLGTCLWGTPPTPLVRSYCEMSGMTEVKDALGKQLDAFKKIALACHYLSEKDCSFKSPLRVRLPFAIPGTRLTLEGDDSLAIMGLQDGCLVLSHQGSRLTVPLKSGHTEHSLTLVINECPVVRYGKCELWLQPNLFNIPGFDDVRKAAATGIEYQSRFEPLLVETLKLIEQHDTNTFEQMQDVIRYVALKPLASGHFTNLSHSDLPGAFIVSVINNPYELADTFIHEFYHNRLFFVEETAPFFDDSDCDPVSDYRYYSPWRNDPRSLYGLLHAVYVSIPVCRYWLRVHRAGRLDTLHSAYAMDRIARTGMQVSLGLCQCEHHAKFTEFGAQLFEDLRKCLGEIHVAMREKQLSFDVPALFCREDGRICEEQDRASRNPLTVRQSVLKHVQDFDKKKQVAPFLRQLGLDQ